MSSYDAETINSPNPFARYAHRNRIKRSLAYVIPRIRLGRVLDYGCGSGVFISRLNGLKPYSAVGYEPFLRERTQRDLPIYSNYEEALSFGPYHTVTLFETIEHLSKSEVDEFLLRCDEALDARGSILISAPIEIGPALLLKEANRTVLRFKKQEYQLLELMKAAFLGAPGRRAENIKSSHKGYDFRESLDFLASRGWSTSVLSYGPLPLGHWYGNSQVFFLANK